MKMGLGLGLTKKWKTSPSGGSNTATFGALTLAGAGAAPAPGGVSSITNAGGTNLVLSGGNLVPDTGGGVTSGTVTYDTGATTTVTAEANTYSFVPNDSAGGEWAALCALGNTLDGKTIKGRAGDQLWQNELDEDASRLTFALASGLTVTSHNNASRLRFIVPTSRTLGARARLVNATLLTFSQVNWYCQFAVGTLNADGTRTGADTDNNGGLFFRGTIGDITFSDCDIDGGLADLIATNGEPFDSTWCHDGWLRADTGPSIAGTVTIENCTFHDSARGFVTCNCTTGSYVITGNSFYNITKDAIRYDNSHPNGGVVAFNDFYSPYNITPPEVDVVSVDTGLDRMTLDSNKFGAATDTFLLNIGPSTTTPPGGLNYPGVGGSNDYNVTIVSVSGGQTVVQFSENITSAGTDVTVRVEPAHADNIQGVSTGDTVSGLEIIGNDFYMDANADGVWPQVIFLEDIASSGVPGYRDEHLIALNRIWGGVAQGIWLYNARRGVVADNTLIQATASPQSTPSLGFQTQFGYDGENSLRYNNVAPAFVNQNSQAQTSGDHTVTYGNESASGLFTGGTGDYTPATIAEFQARFVRNDLNGVYDRSAETADLPAINTPSTITFVDQTDVAVSSTITSAAVQVTSVTAWSGGASSYGALVHVHGGTNAQLRITSDAGGSSVVTDWTSTPSVIEAGEYLWIRQDSSASNSTQTDVFVRVGGAYDTFSVTTVAADVTSPALTSPTAAANGGTGATSLGVTTDEGNGTLYWAIYPTASTPTAADVVAGTGATVSGSQAVSATGVQSVSNQTGLTSETAYKAHYVHDDAATNRSNLATSAEFTTADITAPTLSSPTAAANGATGATSLGVTTDEGNGTLYWAIYPTASTPTAADVVAGTGATVSGSQAVSASGVQSVSNQTGLTASTAYKAHYVHDDSSANRSSVSTSAEFTTAAASGITVGNSVSTFLDQSAGSTAVSLPSGLSENDYVILVLACDDGLDSAGVPGLEAAQGWTIIDGPGTGTTTPGAVVALKKMGSTPDTTVNIDTTGILAASDIAILMQAFSGVDTTTPQDATASVTTGSPGMPNAASITTVTNGALVVAIGMIDDDDVEDTTAPSGYGDLVAYGSATNNSRVSAMMASKEVATAGAEDPGAFGGSGTDQWRAVTVALRPA